MTLKKDQDLIHANERGNGPKKRMEGGDQSDSLAINSPADRRREKHKDEYDKKSKSSPSLK